MLRWRMKGSKGIFFLSSGASVEKPGRFTFLHHGDTSWSDLLGNSVEEFGSIFSSWYKEPQRHFSLFWSAHVSGLPAPSCFLIFSSIQCALRNSAWAGKLLFFAFNVSVTDIEIHYHYLVLCRIHIFWTWSGCLIRNIFDQSPAMGPYRFITACSYSNIFPKHESQTVPCRCSYLTQIFHCVHCQDSHPDIQQSLFYFTDRLWLHCVSSHRTAFLRNFVPCSVTVA